MGTERVDNQLNPCLLPQAAINHKQCIGDILAGLEYIGRLLVRCTAYEEMYLKNYDNLKVPLKQLYEDIAGFLVSAARYMAKGKSSMYLEALCSGRCANSNHFIGRIRASFLDVEGMHPQLEMIRQQEQNLEKDIRAVDACGEFLTTEPHRGKSLD